MKNHPLLSKTHAGCGPATETLVLSVRVSLIPLWCNWGNENINELKLEVNEAAEKPGSENSKLPYHSASVSMQTSWQGTLSARESPSKGAH